MRLKANVMWGTAVPPDSHQPDSHQNARAEHPVKDAPLFLPFPALLSASECERVNVRPGPETVSAFDFGQ
jgi:hypothetical protein